MNHVAAGEEHMGMSNDLSADTITTQRGPSIVDQAVCTVCISCRKLVGGKRQWIDAVKNHTRVFVQRDKGVYRQEAGTPVTDAVSLEVVDDYNSDIMREFFERIRRDSQNTGHQGKATDFKEHVYAHTKNPAKVEKGGQFCIQNLSHLPTAEKLAGMTSHPSMVP